MGHPGRVVDGGRMEPVRSLEQGNGEAAEASGTEGLPAEAAAPTSLPGGVLSGITHLLVSEGPPDLVLAAVADALTEVVPHDTLTLFQVDPPLRVLRPTLVRDAYAQEILAMGAVPYGVGITGKAAESRIPQLVNDAHLDPRAARIPDTPAELCSTNHTEPR